VHACMRARTEGACMRVCVCVCVYACVCVCVCTCVRECVCVKDNTSEGGKERKCVCVCVRVPAKSPGSERAGGTFERFDPVSARLCVCIFWLVCKACL